MVEPTPTRYAKSAEGHRIAYRTLGHGGTPIVVFHAPTCVDLMWDDPVYARFMSLLAEAGEVITFDWRGCGSSDRLPDSGFPTLEAWSDDAGVVLDALGITKAFVITYDLVAPFGLAFAATNPRRMAGLVVVDGWARFLWDEDYADGLDPDAVDRFIDSQTERWGTPDLVRQRGADDAAVVEIRARALRLSCPPTWTAQVNKWCARLDVRSSLDLVACPTLIIQPTHHPYMPRAFSEYLGEHIDRAQLVTRSGSQDILLSQGASEEVAGLVQEFITGAPPTFNHDRSLATVLFTDIVGSTDHASRLGDRAWLDLLSRHDAIVDRELRHHRGRKVNPTGDGMVAIFDGPARAVRCAKAISAGALDLGLEIRAGLHAGEIVHRGRDVGGIAVHLASRISAAAGPGEILVSRTVCDLAMGSDVSFEDRGDHELKGVGTWRLYSAGG